MLLLPLLVFALRTLDLFLTFPLAVFCPSTPPSPLAAEPGLFENPLRGAPSLNSIRLARCCKPSCACLRLPCQALTAPVPVPVPVPAAVVASPKCLTFGPRPSWETCGLTDLYSGARAHLHTRYLLVPT
ncbi:hypothetical protein LY76DRAFT_228719 [Colletotrichum caudatum]|nr:hypothetical protein LY76DRAFT_228719 [Colletotrichum caudatum]